MNDQTVYTLASRLEKCLDENSNLEVLEGPFESADEAKAYANDNYPPTANLYIVYDDLRESGYYLYDLDGPQSPAFEI